MILGIKLGDEREEIDLGALYDLEHVIDAESMERALFIAIACLAIEHGMPFSDAILVDIEGTGSSVLGVDEDAQAEVAKLAYHLFSVDLDEDEHGKYYAYVDGVGWKWTDFDCLNAIDEKFYQEFDGDHAEFAREWMDNTGEDLPYNLESYFDYESYGERLIEEYDVFEWGGREYLFFK